MIGKSGAPPGNKDGNQGKNGAPPGNKDGNQGKNGAPSGNNDDNQGKNGALPGNKDDNLGKNGTNSGNNEKTLGNTHDFPREREDLLEIARPAREKSRLSPGIKKVDFDIVYGSIFDIT